MAVHTNPFSYTSIVSCMHNMSIHIDIVCVCLSVCVPQWGVLVDPCALLARVVQTLPIVLRTVYFFGPSPKVTKSQVEYTLVVIIPPRVWYSMYIHVHACTCTCTLLQCKVHSLSRLSSYMYRDLYALHMYMYMHALHMYMYTMISFYATSHALHGTLAFPYIWELL